MYITMHSPCAPAVKTRTMNNTQYEQHEQKLDLALTHVLAPSNIISFTRTHAHTHLSAASIRGAQVRGNRNMTLENVFFS